VWQLVALPLQLHTSLGSLFCCCLKLNENGNGNGNVTWTLMWIGSPSRIYHEGWCEYVPEIHLSAWILEMSETESLSCQESEILI